MQAPGHKENHTPNVRPSSILFNLSKKEICHPSKGYQKMLKRLKANNKVSVNREEITQEKLREFDLFILGGPKEMFTAKEMVEMKNYIDIGGSIFVMLGEGGENKNNTNINYLLEQCFISVNSDTVLRTTYCKYLHPKEVLVTNGILNKELVRGAKNLPKSKKVEMKMAGKYMDREDQGGSSDNSGLNIVYPYGSSLNVQKPAFPLLSSGPISYPMNRPVSAAYLDPKGSQRKGKLIVIGSVKFFEDEYIEKEDNLKIMDVFIKWLLGSEDIELEDYVPEDADLSEYHKVPDIASLSERLRSCLEDTEEIPRDFTTMFDDSLFKFDTDLIPEAVQLYTDVNVKHEALQLITPQFETPLPPLQAAVFHPSLHDMSGPALDMFDLDEQFSSEKARLAQVTNKYTDENLEYYVQECGEILGVNNQISARDNPKAVLHHIFTQLIKFKKLNQEQVA